MQFIPFSKKTSVAAILAISVVTVTTVLLGGYGVFDYSVERSRLSAELKSGLSVSADELSIGLALPAWNIDRDQIDKIIDGTMKNRVIYSIAVEVAGRVQARARDRQWNPIATEVIDSTQSFIREQRPIVFAGEEIGTVTIRGTRKFLDEELRKNMLSSFILILCLGFVLSFSVYQLHWWWVLRPLKEIETYAQAVNAGGTGAEAIHGGHFRGELENVRFSIDTMVTLLRSRYEALKDETKRRSEAVEAFKASEKRLEVALRLANANVWEVDLKTGAITTDVHLLARRGYGSNNATLGTWRPLLHPEDRSRVDAALARIESGTDSSFHIEYRVLRHDGSWEWVENHGMVAEYDANHKPLRLLGAQIDVTERREAELAHRQSEERARLQQIQLIQADKMASLGVLVSGVAHEINNPTNFIMLNAPLLQRAWEGIMPVLEAYTKENGDFPIGGMSYSQLAPRLVPLIESIHHGAKRIKQIVSDLKDYARMEPPELTRDVDVNAVVRSAVSLLDHMLRKQTNVFRLELAPEPLVIKGSHQRLEQVVINLVQNACDALRSKDEAITIQTIDLAERGHCAIIVTDEGAGIAPEDLSKITDPFYTTKRENGGTGLGLSISAGIVKDHGGELLFSSMPGQGTRVTIELPKKPADGRSIHC